MQLDTILFNFGAVCTDWIHWEIKGWTKCWCRTMVHRMFGGWCCHFMMPIIPAFAILKQLFYARNDNIKFFRVPECNTSPQLPELFSYPNIALTQAKIHFFLVIKCRHPIWNRNFLTESWEHFFLQSLLIAQKGMCQNVWEWYTSCGVIEVLGACTSLGTETNHRLHLAPILSHLLRSQFIREPCSGTRWREFAAVR